MARAMRPAVGWAPTCTMSSAMSVVAVLLLVSTCCLGDGTNGVYMMVFTSAQNWTNGLKCCEQNAMTLSKVDSKAKFNALRDYMYSYMEGIYYTITWTGLRAGNVSDLSTYTWADGTSFDVGNASWVQWDPIGLVEGPACFALTTHDYKYSYKNFLRAYPCSEVFALGCEMTDPDRGPGPVMPGCPSFDNYLLRATPPGGLAKSANADQVAMRGRFVKQWSNLLPFTHAKASIGWEKVDCLLFCLAYNQTQGTQLSYLPTVAKPAVNRCTCLTNI